MATMRSKWHPPPAPSPRILHLPRRHRRPRNVVSISPLIPNASSASKPACTTDTARNLAALLDQERRVRDATAAVASASTCTAAGVGSGTSRTSAATSSTSSSSSDSSEDRWRFQAEILRAECNFLRMEREVGLKKLDRNRAQMTTTLRSTMNTLVSGRKKLDGSDCAASVLDAVIASLEEKLEEFKLEGRSGTARTRSRNRNGSNSRARVSEPQWNNARGNFDRQASVLRRRLQKMGDNVSVKEIREIAVHPAPEKDHAAEIDKHRHNEKMDTEEGSGQWSRCRRYPDMEMLKRRMEGVSKGMLERMEECSTFLLTNTNNNNSSSRKGSGCCSQRVLVGRYTEGDADKATNHNHYPQLQQMEEKTGLLSCCNCKEVVGRIMQQVKAETGQWSEMQRMLEQVKLEMDDLRSSRDVWQRRAVSSEINFHSLHSQMLDWKRKARSSEQGMNELQSLVSKLQNELLLQGPSSRLPPQRAPIQSTRNC